MSSATRPSRSGRRGGRWRRSGRRRGRAGSQVDHPVGGTDGRLVVLDDHDAVPLVAKVDQAGEEAFRVAGVQPGGRFVEDVADSDQARADLRGQADSLKLAAGEGVGPPLEGQVAQADTVEERQPGGNLADQGGTDQVERRGEVERLEPKPRGDDRQGRDRVDRLPPDRDLAGLGLEPAPPQAGQGPGPGTPRSAARRRSVFASDATVPRPCRSGRPRTGC